MIKSKTLNIPVSNFAYEDVVLGIDEAGRGPVLGPMVYACAYWTISNQEEITKHFKFADSKVLTEVKREEIYNNMCQSKSILE
jgi:ribonuclease H2 subunit A